MSDAPAPTSAPNEIRDRAAKPPGLIPKHIQRWIVIGISVVMVLIVWLGGSGTKAKPGAKPGQPGYTGVEGGTAESALADYQKSLEEKDSIIRRQKELLKGQGGAGTGPVSAGEDSAAPGGGAPGGVAAAAEEIEQERLKRRYTGSFAPSVTLTYRGKAEGGDEGDFVRWLESAAKQPEGRLPFAGTASRAEVVAPRAPQAETAEASRESTEDPSPADDQMSSSARALRQAQETLMGIQGMLTGKPAGTSGNGKPSGKPGGAKAPGTDTPTPGTKTFRLFEGQIIETVLLNRLDGDYSGPVTCMVSTPVWSLDRQHLLIPHGTKVLGEASKVEAWGQARLAVAFHRMVMPDGYSVSLDQFKGLNQIGETGLKDKVNRHYFQLFGVSVALGLMAGWSQAGTQGGIYANGTDSYRQGVADSLTQSSLKVLDKFLNIMPTVTIREGHRVKVCLSADLLLPDVRSHALPGDL